MLDLMRKHAGSWMIKVVLGIIVVVFVFWGVGSFRNRQSDKVAEVNGHVITYETFRQAYLRLIEQYRQVYGNQLSDDMMEMLRPNEQALNQLIDRALLLQEADRLKIAVSDQEVAEAIRRQAAFQNNGVFEVDRYRRILSLNNMTPEYFEASLKEDLRINKAQSLVVNGVTVLDVEAHEWFDWFNTEVNVQFINFDPNRYKDLAPTEEQVNTYFKEHGDQYRTEPRVKVRYLHFNPEMLKERVSIDQEEIAQYYQQHPDQFKKEKTVEARHILFKLDPDADDQKVAQVKEKALEVYKMAESGKDFAELAKNYSEGPTREQGGWLGAFTRETMVKPFADKAFSMEAGQISEPVQTQFGWHIIKVEKVNGATIMSLESATDEIRNQLAGEKARALARQRAENVYDSVFDGDELKDIEETGAVQAIATDFFTRTQGPEGIADAQRFAESAFELETMAISEIMELNDGFYLLQVIDRQPSQVPPFEAVAEKVRSDVISLQQNDKAKADAQSLLSKLREGDSMAEAGARFNEQVKETGYFKRTGSIPQIGSNPQISQAAFGLSQKNPLYQQAIEGQNGWYVIRLKDRKPPQPEGFEKEKTMITQRLIDQKKQAALRQWLADLRARSMIQINEKMIQ
jgi:peptidyl-prolyl cis-trans isomerase D